MFLQKIILIVSVCAVFSACQKVPEKTKIETIEMPKPSPTQTIAETDLQKLPVDVAKLADKM